MPERAIIKELRRELSETKSPKRQQEIEIHLIMLLCLLEIKKLMSTLAAEVKGRGKT